MMFIFLSAGVLFDGAFSLWVSLRYLRNSFAEIYCLYAVLYEIYSLYAEIYSLYAVLDSSVLLLRNKFVQRTNNICANDLASYRLYRESLKYIWKLFEYNIMNISLNGIFR